VLFQIIEFSVAGQGGAFVRKARNEDRAVLGARSTPA
jgi:hypothetical protein